MRVLISASTFPLRPDDGLPRFVYDLAEALTRHCEVIALAPDAPGASRRERMGGVDVRRFTYFRPRSAQQLAYGHGIRENLRGSPLALLQVPALVAAQARATRRLVRREGIGLVNSHWLIPQGLSAALARGARPRFRHVLSVHAGDVYMLARLPFGGAVARYVVERSDFVFSVGSHVRESLEALVGRPCSGALQPMGARVERFRQGPGEPAAEARFPGGFLLFVGRFSEKKGLVYLLRALPRVLERHPQLGLVAIGYGAEEPSLRAEVARLGIGASVEFAGRRNHAEVGRYLRSCRAAVVPSIVDRRGETEGMPTVVVEAMAAGARVVGSAVDGIPDVIRHAENGWLCRAKDPADLAEKILLALADRSPSAILERSARTADALDWSAVAARYAGVFRELAAPPGEPAR